MIRLKHIASIVVISIFTISLVACGEGDKQPDPDSSKNSGSTCCKVCKAGKACGDSCISRDKQCSKGAGCACNGKVQLTGANQWIPLIMDGRIDGVSGLMYSSGAESGVTDSNGRFTYELGLTVTFQIDDIYLTLQPHQVDSVWALGERDQGQVFLNRLLSHDIDQNSGNGIQLILPE
ncbi:MAG: hypothetical protein OEZ58_09895 [Gammaproteobacteria bacterium]|nr:hypothetical protein [Gammaproteobacteria bacterium]MDH5729291.1 hypothetical protein [Gammaproteobacteria bacterium]